MAENTNQPKNYDAVLGGENSSPVNAAILGGLPGVKKRLGSGVVEARMAALQAAINYGQEGLDLVIQALKDKDVQVALAAWELLQNRREPQVKQTLEKYLTLLSDVDMVYYRLRDLLAEQDWSAADRRTRSILLRICDREDLWLRREDIEKLPSTDLDTIDRLWTYYSKGRFGFSVQKLIWQDCVEKTQSKISAKTYELFCDRVGWQMSEDTARRVKKIFFLDKRDDIPCNLNAPIGHLPSVYAFGGGNRDLQPYTNDTESTMGFYSIDGYWSVWTEDSFFGPDMVKCFLDRIKSCKI